ncbi:hypothetical protein [Agromyces marinus]|uniref:CAAX protease self-immunity n=1 Tax=Agromyces marinus TaxID=1389020 RepID=A0ABM8H1R3_9MICO|nr:hypothetical protein [Agromyces marinus]UIP57217.1 hypothetical protein DSM26151_00720 [Agromyces marinus]BDZ54694.1 hypothetical protein GCM10025870_17670 [Agromyces marinus]
MTLKPRNALLAGRRARAGAAFLAVSVILAATSVSVDLAISGIAAPEWRETVAIASSLIGGVAVWGALPLGLLLLLTAGHPSPWRSWSALAAAVAAPVLVWWSGLAHSAFLILVALVAAVGGYALIAAGIGGRGARTGSRRAAIAAIIVSVLVEVAVVAIGLMHLLVWNPVAKIPDLDLAQIYDVIGTRDPGPSGWAIGSVLVTVVATVFAVRGVRAGLVDAHDIATGGLLLVHATTFFLWWAGFGLGMTIADSFATTGYDASPAGALLALAGAVCLAVAILMQIPGAGLGGSAEPSTDEPGTAESTPSTRVTP